MARETVKRRITGQRPKLWDNVRVEMGWSGGPRWQYARDNNAPGGYTLKDHGYSGKYMDGAVANILENDDILEVHLVNEDNEIQTYSIAGEKHPCFTPGQWGLPGFCEIIREYDSLICTCGSWATYGINNGAHSDWCDAAGELDE